MLGVDNIRYDVRLSPGFRDALKSNVLQLIAKFSQADTILEIDPAPLQAKTQQEFKRQFRDLMLDVVNRSKLHGEPQIDYLGQVAVIKIIKEEILSEFELITGQIKNIIRKYEVFDHQDISEAVKTKEALTNVIQNRERILRNVCHELFKMLLEVNQADLKTMREANFGTESLLPDDILSNPILMTENPFNDSFMIEEYDVLFGRRLEDPDKYDNLLRFTGELLRKIEAKVDATENREPFAFGTGPDGASDQTREANAEDGSERKIVGWMKNPDNIDLLINYYKTQAQIKKHKKEHQQPSHISILKARQHIQKQLLTKFYREFNKAKLLDRICAFYEMLPVYDQYCPPLVPQQIIHFLLSRRARRSIVSRLKRLKKIHGQSYALRPLRKVRKRMRQWTYKDKKVFLIRYLKGLFRYHRDLTNYKILKDAIDRINLVSDDKIINLSRANNTLYEFLLPHEQVLDEKPIRNHVIIKADVRGSTDITRQMRTRGLNPASYFSLNFFDPISEILPEYGAVKVFIEGDAVILSIFEREETPGGWYSVARACGIAINILIIIQRYNAISKRHLLPILELGIGICFRESAPTFLFDGDNRIMISSAINRADRMSGCHRVIRERMKNDATPFNLYKFQLQSEKDQLGQSGEKVLRYNVNGIELGLSGFEKLRQEIKLKPVVINVPGVDAGQIKLYTGQFPTVSGKYQRLVIREAVVAAVNPQTLEPLQPTPHKYYEVCSNPKLYQYIRDMK